MNDFDVVVVGGGGSGLATAAAAAAEGARVALIEKNAKPGGTSALSVGSFTAAGTRLQRRAGIDDCADAHYADLDLFARPAGAQDNLELRRLYVDHAADTLHWLMSLGVAFHGPSPEPPHTRPRLHLALPHSGAYIYSLLRACRRLGVQIHTQRAAKKLLVENGRVTGVETADGALGVRKGVILATGDYSGAASLLREMADKRYAAMPALNAANTGDGHTLARSVGARVLNGHVVIAERRFPSPASVGWLKRLPPTYAMGAAVRLAMSVLPSALLRPLYAMYMTAYLAPSPKLLDAGAKLVDRGDAAFIVFDSSVARRFERWPDFISTAPGIGYAYFSDYRRYRPDIFRQAESADELARLIGIGSAEVQGGEPPWYALGPLFQWVMTTDGGLAVSQRFEVLRGDAPIPGLFAVGSVGQGGLLLPGHGQHLGWAFTSGRLCGRLLATS